MQETEKGLPGSIEKSLQIAEQYCVINKPVSPQTVKRRIEVRLL
jgi:hypothetical protein